MGILVLEFDFFGIVGDGGFNVVGRVFWKVFLKDMMFLEFERWVEFYGYKVSRVVMLWCYLYGNGKWVEFFVVIFWLNKEFVLLFEERVEFVLNL